MSGVTHASGIHEGRRLDEATRREVLARFEREGYALIAGVLSAEEVGLIRALTDRWIDQPPRGGVVVDNYLGAEVLRYTQSLDRAFCDMLVRQPLLELAEAGVCGECGFVGQNVIRGKPGGAITRWHVDDTVEWPLPDDIPRHDPRMRMPVTWFSFQIALSDITAIEHGPTQVVPGSHYSGRDVPGDEAQLVFEGRGPEPIFCRAGDVYLFNHQLWHRGMPNTGDRTRYLMQNQYARRWCVRRFGLPENGCTLPEAQLAGASDRLRRMLGR